MEACLRPRHPTRALKTLRKHCIPGAAPPRTQARPRALPSVPGPSRPRARNASRGSSSARRPLRMAKTGYHEGAPSPLAAPRRAPAGCLVGAVPTGKSLSWGFALRRTSFAPKAPQRGPLSGDLVATFGASGLRGSPFLPPEERFPGSLPCSAARRARGGGRTTAGSATNSPEEAPIPSAVDARGRPGPLRRRLFAQRALSLA